MKSKSLIKLGLVGFLLFPRIARAESKPNSFLKNFEVGISYGIQFDKKNPAKNYIRQVDDDFRIGKYLKPVSPISQWKNISLSSFSMAGGEASVLYKIGKKIKIGPVAGIKTGSCSTTYNKNYDFVYTGTGEITPWNFKRNETFNVSEQSIGLGAKISLSKKVDLALKGMYNSFKIDGDVDYEMNTNTINEIRGPPWPYTQWRKANYNGTGKGNSFEIGLDFNITKNLSVGISAGSRNGKVKTTGSEVKSETSNPEISWTKNYSPEFNLNSTYYKVKGQIKF